jgi:hypothetical protein
MICTNSFQRGKAPRFDGLVQVALVGFAVLADQSTRLRRQ